MRRSIADLSDDELANERASVRNGHRGTVQFGKVERPVLEDPELGPDAKLTYAALSVFRDWSPKPKPARPSIKTLCRLSSLPRNRVSRGLQELVLAGYVTKSQVRRNEPARYQFVPLDNLERQPGFDELQAKKSAKKAEMRSLAARRNR
jgi:hypothetical protein